MPLRIDAAHAPVLVVELHDRLTAVDIETFLQTGEGYIARGEPYAFVFVPRGMAVPSFAELKTLIAWMRAHKRDLDRWYRAQALVTESAVMRGALRAILSLSPIDAPQLVTADLDEAIAWAVQQLRASIRASGTPPS
ncbi:MAG TPA: STAS/SEC14 domain-containing protein [Nannocystaceae bacterium]|nr:STAS/SEC14 domain-containing protein [Nannocystaceae bacterium]